MREYVRGEEHDTTTQLIKIQVFTHASCVTKFSLLIFKVELRKQCPDKKWPLQLSAPFPLVYDHLKGFKEIFVLLSIGFQKA